MTVNYSRLMGKQNPGTIFLLFARWRGSIFKTLYREGLIYFGCYALVSLVYRLALDGWQRRRFEDVVILCRNWSTMIPVTFILGFYVSVVFSRWQGFVSGIPWTDKTHFLLGYITSKHPRAVIYRRAIVRYVVAAQVLALRAVSLQVKKRFPTLQHIVDSSLLTEEEAAKLTATESMPGDTLHWLPMHWAVNILHKAHRKGHIASELLLDSAVKHINEIRGQHGDFLVFDWINVPLVYSQLVALAVWAHFSVGLFGFQWVDSSHPLLKDSDPSLDLYFPIFTLLQFVCFVGWLRVAQSMLNPLGEEDDDLELNAVIDQNLRKGLLLADDLYGDLPELREDGFDDVPELPHTLASLPFAAKEVVNSVQDVEIPKEEARTVSAAPSMESGLHSQHSGGSGRGRLARLQATIKRSIAGQAVSPDKEPRDREPREAKEGPNGDSVEAGRFHRRQSSASDRDAGPTRMETLEEADDETQKTFSSRDGEEFLAQMASEHSQPSSDPAVPDDSNGQTSPTK